MSNLPYYKFRYLLTTPADQSDTITAEEVRAWSIIDETSDVVIDASDLQLIESMIPAAVNYWINETGVYPIHVVWTASLDSTPWEKNLWLRNLPIVSIDKVYGLDADDAETVADAADYAADLENGIVSSYSWPSGDKNFGSFNIEYTHGLGVNAAAVPEDVKTALKQIVTHWFEHREAYTEKQFREVPGAAARIIQQYKPARV